MKVFIGWSGEMSRNVAQVLHEKLPYFIQALEPFVSTEDISSGAAWGDALKKALRHADFGIFCITPLNITSPWLNYELGALRVRAVPFLFHVDPAKLQGPLQLLQAKTYEKKDVFNLLADMNRTLAPQSQLEQSFLSHTFERWWPGLEDALNNIADPDSKPETNYSWLYSLNDLKKIELDSNISSIMLVTPCPDRDLSLVLAEEIVSKNLERRVHYTIILSKDTNPAVINAINNAFSSRRGQLTLALVPGSDFQRSVATHYILLNYERDDSDLRVFFEVPVEARDYWIEVNRKAALDFAFRFRELLKYEVQPESGTTEI